MIEFIPATVGFAWKVGSTLATKMASKELEGPATHHVENFKAKFRWHKSLPVNGDLLRASRESLRAAAQLLWHNLDRQVPDRHQLTLQRRWLKALKDTLSDPKNLETIDDQISLDDADFEQLFQNDLGDSMFGKRLAMTFLKWLRATIVVGEPVPTLEECVREGWSLDPKEPDQKLNLWQAYCHFFHRELKTKPAVLAIFSSELQAGCRWELRQLRQSFDDSAAEVRERFHRLEEQIRLLTEPAQLQQFISESFSQHAGEVSRRLDLMESLLPMLPEVKALTEESLRQSFVIADWLGQYASRITLLPEMVAGIERIERGIEELLAAQQSPSASRNPGVGRVTEVVSMQLRVPVPLIFVGRTKHLSWLKKQWDCDRPKPTCLFGESGIGKSTIALKVLHSEEIVARYGDRRFVVRCDDVTSTDGLWTAIAIQIGVTQSSNLKQTVLAQLSQSGAVLVLDNFEDPWRSAQQHAIMEVVQHLVAISTLAVCVTMVGNGPPVGGIGWERPPVLSPLSENDALKLFVNLTSKQFPMSDPDLKTLVATIERLPLEIEWLAHAAMVRANVREVLDEYRASKPQVFQKSSPTDQDRHAGLERAYRVSLASLSQHAEADSARRALAMLSLLPDGVALFDWPDLFGTGATEALRPLRGLALILEETKETKRVRLRAALRALVRHTILEEFSHE